MARVIDQVLGATTSSVVGEITRELVNASDGAGLHLADNGYVDLTNSAAAEFGTSDFSIEFIVNQTGDNTSDNYIYTSHVPGNNRFYIYNDISANKLNLEFVDGSASVTTKVLDYDMAADYGTPTHYVIAFDRSGDATLYKNGNSVATVDISSTSAIDIGSGNANAGRLSAGTGYGVLGTFYRFRTWNKLVDAKALFERADVDFADQYGSQTSLVDAGASVFTSGTYSWSAYGSNTIANVGNALEITYVNHAYGASNGLRDSSDLTTDLTVGKKYRLTVDAKYTGGSAGSKLQLSLAGSNTDFATLTTSLVTYTYEFTTDTAAGGGLRMSGMSAGNVVTIDNWYLREIGCVSDYDLAFANPTQSLTVQDRSGVADGTASTSGVTQVQPVVQLNSTSARIGTFAATAADGQILADGKSKTAPSYSFGHTTATGMYSPGANQIRFSTASTDRLTIDSSGNVNVNGGGYVKIGPADTQAELRLYRDDATINTSGIAIGDINFGGADADNDNAARLRVKSDGAWTSTSSPTAFEFQTCPSGSESPQTRLVIGSDGLCTFSNGIAFPAPTPASAGTPAASSVLDVFEIGTWTPVLNGVTGGNSTGVYTRIGNMCYFSFYSGSITSTAVDATFSGLPFECSAYYGTITASHNTWVPNADSGYVAVSTHTGKFTPSASISTATATAGTGRYIMFSGYYRVK